MIFNLLINVILMVIGAIMDVFHLSVVTTLPTIGGYDIDSALVTGTAELRTFATAFWPVADMLLGFVALMGYFAVKMMLGFILGHRAPGRH